jgi:hypothetical protein
MTNLYPNSNINNTAGEGAGQPGDAPVPNAAQIMQGNPQGSQFQPSGVQPPQPLNPVQQLTGTQVSNGQIPVHVHPNNVAAPPGTDSLMAQMSRGQVIMADSTYGQGGFVPQNGGCSPQVPSPGANVSQPTLARVASAISIPNPPVYAGN